MYRKGLSSRANKVSSLVANSDNSGTGSTGQASVPTAGVFGIRKNVFRNLPRIPPKKSVTPFSSMKSKPKSSEAESETSQPAPEPAAASFPLTLKFNSPGEQDLTPTSNTHVVFNSDYTYDIVGMGEPYTQDALMSPSLKSTTGEFGIPIPLPDTLDYTNVNVQISWDEAKVLSTFVGIDTGTVGYSYNNIQIKLYLAIDGNETQSGKGFYFNGSNTNTNSNFNSSNKTFTKDSLSLIFYNEAAWYSILDSMTRTGFWDPAPLKISLKNLVVTISEPE